MSVLAMEQQGVAIGMEKASPQVQKQKKSKTKFRGPNAKNLRRQTSFSLSQRFEHRKKLIYFVTPLIISIPRGIEPQGVGKVVKESLGVIATTKTGTHGPIDKVPRL